LAEELHGDQATVKLRYAFSALFSTGVMMPSGFEYGFRRRLDVVKTRPQDWEQPQWDLGGFITAVNRLKTSYRVFNEEGPIDLVNVGNPQICVLVKSSVDKKEKAVLLLNKDRQHPQSCFLGSIAQFFPGTTQVQDISPEDRLQHTPDFLRCQLKPSGIYVIYAR